MLAEAETRVQTTAATSTAATRVTITTERHGRAAEALERERDHHADAEERIGRADGAEVERPDREDGGIVGEHPEPERAAATTRRDRDRKQDGGDRDAAPDEGADAVGARGAGRETDEREHAGADAVAEATSGTKSRRVPRP